MLPHSKSKYHLNCRNTDILHTCGQFITIRQEGRSEMRIKKNICALIAIFFLSYIQTKGLFKSNCLYAIH